MHTEPINIAYLLNLFRIQGYSDQVVTSKS